MTFARDLQRLEILSGPEYFDCVTLRCRMRRQACAERWRKARQLTAESIYDDHRGRLLVCRECVTGRANAEQAAPTETRARRRAVIREQKKNERSDRMPKKQTKTPRAAGETPWRKPCVNCHRVMAIVRGGLCGLCARAAHKKAGAERDVALEQARKDAIRLAVRAASRETNKIFMPGTATAEEREALDLGATAPPAEALAASAPGVDQPGCIPPGLVVNQPPASFPAATLTAVYPPTDPGAPAGYASGSYPVSIIFTGPADESLFLVICREAEKNRRSIANEILVALDAAYRCRMTEFNVDATQSAPGKEQS
jgi:hypothetical protein